MITEDKNELLKSLASDNYSGAHPKVIEAITKCNVGHVRAYGYDEYTKRADQKFNELFGSDAYVFYVFNGTAANVIGLAGITPSYSSIVCSDIAHINLDECAAPQRFIGCKLSPIPTKNGKLTLDGLQKQITRIGDHHYAQPRVISITQSTEYGTVYTRDEIKDIVNFAHENKLVCHMDGARLANACVSLGCSLKEITSDLGIDVLSFGGTKNGIMFGDAIVFFKKEFTEDFRYVRKQGMQLASKMRFISCQFEALLTDNLWFHNASHANKMAKLLESELRNIPGIEITQKVEANAVFVKVPKLALDKLNKNPFYYLWNEKTNEIRLMTAFDTTEEDIFYFVKLIKHSVVAK